MNSYNRRQLNRQQTPRRARVTVIGMTHQHMVVVDFM